MPYATHITVKKIDGKVRQSIRNIGNALPRLTKRQMKTALEGAKYDASGQWSGGANYNVPPPTGSTYARTGTYGASFKIVDNGGTSYSLNSDAVNDKGVHYTKYVGGTAYGEGQAAIHAGRWPLIGEMVNKWVQSLITETRKALSELIRGEGLGL